MKTKKTAVAALFAGSVASLPAWSAGSLSLDRYLEQVRIDNKDVRSSLLASEGAAMYLEKGTLLLAPTAFGDISYLDDKKPPLTTLTGDRTAKSTYTLGVRKLTTFGLEGQVSYSLIHTQLFNVPTFNIAGVGSISPPSNYYEGRTEIVLTQSVWRNGFGRGTRANQELLEAQASATRHTENFSIKSQLAVAESAYWRLALARETLNVSRESIERAMKIRDWAARRERFALGDKADRLQAEAALSLRKLDLQAAEDESRQAALAFNAARQIDSDEVPERLQTPTLKKLLALKAPDRAEFREDVLAAKDVTRAAQANVELALQQLSPDIQLYGLGALNSRDNGATTAVSDSFKTDRPTWLVGLRFSAPLDLPQILQSRKGHALQREAAELDFERKVFEQENAWKDLNRTLSETQRRLQLSQEIEGAQREKLMYEKKRHEKGRTTTYQVLLFEQDFASAQLTRIARERDVLAVLAQMKVFRGAK